MSSLLLLIAVLLTAAGVFLLRRFLRKRWYWSVSAGVLAVAMFLASAALLLSFLFLHMMCGEYVFPYRPSPDQRRLARVTEFDCGATTPFTSYVELRAAGFPTSLSLLGARARWRRTVFIIEHDPRLIQLIWTGNRELTIRYPKPDRTDSYKCDSTWQDVRIKCEVYTPDEHAPLPQMFPNRWLW